jgi:hypothetical protein
MAAKHILSLEVIPVSNQSIFSIKDTSQYAPNLAADCPELLILPPGFTIPFIIECKTGFNLNLDPCSINLQQVNCGQVRNNFPDGIYAVKYRVQPHAKVFVEYNHLRITSIMTKYYEKLNDLDIHPSEPSSSKKKVLSEMAHIKTMIDAAKAKVEYGSSPNEGWEMYRYAEYRLKKITPNSSC